MIEVNKAVAHPWFCDVLGHMTTRFYVAMFDDASYHFLYALCGWSGASDDEGKLGWVDAKHVINYQVEVEAGDLLEVRAKLDRIGTKSITASYKMQNITKGESAATLECVYVFFDLQARKALPITEEIRDKLQQHLEG